MFQPLKEGYRAWAAGFGLPATLSGSKLDGAYEFINWFLDGWAGAYLNRQGYYSAVLETAKAKMEPYEWAYWMEGKPAAKDIKSPDGDLLAKAGKVRDGGSLRAAHGRHRLLERGDGREQVHGAEVERVRRRLTARDRADDCQAHPTRRAGAPRCGTASAWLQATPFAAVFVFFFLVPLAWW